MILIYFFFFNFVHLFIFSSPYLMLLCMVTLPRTPKYPSFLHPPPLPIALSNPLPFTSPTPPPIPKQTAASDRRGAWEVQPARQANSSYLTSHLTADRHGGSVQVYTPHLINRQPPPNLHGVRSVSNNPNKDKYTHNMACKWKGKTQRHFCDTICFPPPPLGETIYFQGISLILRQIFYLRVKQL